MNEAILTDEEHEVFLRFIARHSRNPAFLRHESSLREVYALKLHSINFPLGDLETWRRVGDYLVEQAAAASC